MQPAFSLRHQHMGQSFTGPHHHGLLCLAGSRNLWHDKGAAVRFRNHVRQHSVAPGARCHLRSFGIRPLCRTGRIRKRRTTLWNLGDLVFSRIEVLSRGVDRCRRNGGRFGNDAGFRCDTRRGRRNELQRLLRLVFVLYDGPGHARKRIHVHARRQASKRFRSPSGRLSRCAIAPTGPVVGTDVPDRLLLVKDSTVQYSTVQYSTVQYSTVQYSTVQVQVQYSTVQYSTVQYSTSTVAPEKPK
jgi:hypothetical protein